MRNLDGVPQRVVASAPSQEEIETTCVFGEVRVALGEKREEPDGVRARALVSEPCIEHAGDATIRLKVRHTYEACFDVD